MKKSDFWQKIWIPITRRLPPENDTEILVWNYDWKRPMVMQADIARYSAISFLNEKENGIDSKLPKTSSDRLFSHWCSISPPKTGNTNEQKRRRSKRKKVH